MSRTRLTTPRAIVAGAAFLAVALFGGIAFAGNTFIDVTPANPFYAEIEQFGGAGISGGYDDGTFRPSNAVSRQAMAAFMTRGLTNMGYSTGTSAQTVGASQITLLTVDYLVPGESGGGQRLIVHATASWRTNVDTKAEACNNAATQQCEFLLGVYNNGSLVHETVGRITEGNDGGTISVIAVIPNAPTNIERDITLRATPGTNLQSGDLQLTERQMVVTNAPFFDGS